MRALPTRVRALVPAERRQRYAVLAGACVVLIALAVIGIIRGPELFDHRQTLAIRPPTPPAPSSTPAGRSTKAPPTTRRTDPGNGSCRSMSGSVFGGDRPARICLPSIGVDASVMLLGLNADRTVQVPPLSRVADAGWYRDSSPPGASGPTVILGHVDSAQYGTGVFYRLGQLASGDQVVVTRGDGTRAVYKVTRVREVSKSAFPTSSVYGDTADSQIRLVTCGGRFDAGTGNYVDNIIAYGTLTSGKI